MPKVEKLFQESVNPTKPKYIHGHMFGGLGVLVGSIRNWVYISLSIWLSQIALVFQKMKRYVCFNRILYTTNGGRLFSHPILVLGDYPAPAGTGT